MKNAFINNVLQSTLDFLNNKQAELLKEVLKEEYLIDIDSLEMVYNEHNKPYFKNCPSHI